MLLLLVALDFDDLAQFGAGYAQHHLGKDLQAVMLGRDTVNRSFHRIPLAQQNA